MSIQMEASSDKNLSCRLCLTSQYGQPYYPLFGPTRNEQVFSKQLQQMFGNLVEPDDELSQVVCCECAQSIMTFYDFYTKMVKNQYKLINNKLGKKEITAFRTDRYHPKELTKKKDGRCDFELRIEKYLVNSAFEYDTTVMYRNADGNTSPKLFNDELVVNNLLYTRLLDLYNIDCRMVKNEDIADIISLLDDFKQECIANPSRYGTEISTEIGDDLNGIKYKEGSPQRTDAETSSEMTNNEHRQSIDTQMIGNAFDETMLGENCFVNSSVESNDNFVDVRNTVMHGVNHETQLQLENANFLNNLNDGILVGSRVTDNSQTQKDPQYYIRSHDKSTQVRVEPVYYGIVGDNAVLAYNSNGASHRYTLSELSDSCQITFMCDVCRSYFTNREELSQHINCRREPKSTSEVYVKSEEVEIIPSNETRNSIIVKNEQLQSLEEKYFRMDPSEKELCDLCGEVTNNIEVHRYTHEKLTMTRNPRNNTFLKKWFKCNECNKKIFSEAYYQFHMAQHRGVDSVKCFRCDFRANNISDYNRHVITHNGGKHYICHFCRKCFFTRSAMSDHLRIHMDGEPYVCEICGKRSKTSRMNAQHRLLQHKRYFRCKKCNRGFSQESKLMVHYGACAVLPLMHKEKETNDRFFCKLCNSYIRSTSEASVLFHEAKHKGLDGIHCQFCNLLCRTAYAYKCHILTHTDERPFRCNLCDKRFRTKGCLVQHTLVHRNDYKYTCNFCGKKSKKLTTHVNHVHIHTDTKPYVCPDCNRPFRQLSDMKKHRRTHLKYMVNVNMVNSHTDDEKSDDEHALCIDTMAV